MIELISIKVIIISIIIYIFLQMMLIKYKYYNKDKTFTFILINISSIIFSFVIGVSLEVILSWICSFFEIHTIINLIAMGI